jgi:hypothetical protein
MLRLISLGLVFRTMRNTANFFGQYYTENHPPCYLVSVLQAELPVPFSYVC